MALYTGQSVGGRVTTRVVGRALLDSDKTKHDKMIVSTDNVYCAAVLLHFNAMDV